MLDTATIPPFVSHVTSVLQNAARQDDPFGRGFEAYLVGGCVRDLLRGATPHDWDIATNARPDQVIALFSDRKTLNENDFGTVTVLNIPPDKDSRVPAIARPTGGAEEGVTPDASNTVQITTYRSDGTYSDTRHPDAVSYETDIRKDLERRDFTMNAIAWNPFGVAQDTSYKGHLIDPYGGIKDIKDKVINCVLYPDIRFQEDALRMLRAVRFSTTLGFAVSPVTLSAIGSSADLLMQVSGERIRDEFIKIIDSAEPAFGISLLEKTGLLKHIVPELYAGIGCEQKGAHIYDVYQHLLHALQHAADKGFSTIIRLTALLHDIGKPTTRRYDRTKDKYTFFGHEVVGARMTKQVLERLRFSRETVARVTSLVRNHMFFSDTEQITLSAVRRVIVKVGASHIWELMEVRECDRVGMKKAEAPYRLRKYHAMIDEALHDPISVGQLAIDGNYLMNELRLKPGPRMGWMLHALLEEVLENPALNTIEQLSERALDFNELEDKDLRTLGEKGKEKKDELEQAEVKELHMKHGVKK